MQDKEPAQTNMIKWTTEDTNFLIRYYPDTTVTVGWIASNLNRSKQSVQDKATKNLKLVRDVSWKSEELELAKCMYLQGTPLKDISTKLNRSETGLKCKLNGLGIFRSDDFNPNWTTEQDNYLIENYSSMSARDIASYLGKAIYSVQDRVRSLGIQKGRKTTRWATHEVAKLNNLYGTKSYEEIAEELGRSLDSVMSKLSDSGIAKSKPNNTAPELIVENVLKQLGISYASQKKIFTNKRTRANHAHYYRCDFVIGSKVIEVQGNYWHCNPSIYQDGPKDKIQANQIVKDELKKSCLETLGYVVMYIWESDCSNTEYLLEYIKSIV